MAIETIAIVNHTHVDFGYTDHTLRTERENVEYIDQAVEYILRSEDYPAGAQFAWTQEQLYPLRSWWRQAGDEQKERFFTALETGRLEITGTPLNVTAYMDREEWETAMHWIDDGLWERLGVTDIMQTDVNGIHTGGLELAYDRGIRRLWMGPNSYYGAVPMPAPAAFRWRIAPGKELFVWLNPGYNNGYYIFNSNWRVGPVPERSDLRYRQPEAGDIWRSDENSIMEAHRLCLESLERIEGNASAEESGGNGATKICVSGGYKYSTLPVSVTNQWRIDNDPPFYPIVDFVKRWNELGLKPRIILCTAGKAMEMVRREAEGTLPVFSGQWVDWWANGGAASPVEKAFSREAKRVLRAARSEQFGEITAEQKREVREILEDLCLYDEHSFGSWQSAADPYSFRSRSEEAEKNIFVYRALDGARGLLAERARLAIQDVKNEIVVWNTCGEAVTAMIAMPQHCMRGKYGSVMCRETGERFPIRYTCGTVNFRRPAGEWELGPENVSRTFSDRVERGGIELGPVTIPAGQSLHLVPQEADCPEPELRGKETEIETDDSGWPVRIRFEDQPEPLVCGSFGDFFSVTADGVSPRWTFREIFENSDPIARERLRKEHLSETQALYGVTVRETLPNGLRFEQEVRHPALRYGRRILTVDRLNALVRLELRIDRRSSFDPELLLLRFRSPCEGRLPTVSNAGAAFRPFEEQLPGSCMDHYAIDGWISYPGGWLLSCRDNALVSFGTAGAVERKTALNGRPEDIFVRLFDNTWDTNFTPNACGRMVFRFTAVGGVRTENAAAKAVTLDAEPVVAVKMGY